MDFTQYYHQLDAGNRRLRDALPATMAGFSHLHAAAFEPGALGTATKELIALGIAINVPCEGCIAYHVLDALRAGATAEEITEAIGVAIVMGGGPSVIYGSQALEALRQYQAHPKEMAVAHG